MHTLNNLTKKQMNQEFVEKKLSFFIAIIPN